MARLGKALIAQAGQAPPPPEGAVVPSPQPPALPALPAQRDGRVQEQRGAGHVIPRTHDYGQVKQDRHLERFGLKDKAPQIGAIVEPRRR